MLRDEAIQAQSANVDIVSGATLTSEAFIRSLGGALGQAAPEPMRATRILMGMPITVDVVGAARRRDPRRGLRLFRGVDRRFSTYKDDSEIAAINQGATRRPRLQRRDARGAGARRADAGARPTAISTSAPPDGTLDPSGIVKGWAIRNAAAMIAGSGARDFFVDAGGDIQSSGRNADGEAWSVGIRNPFDSARDHQGRLAARQAASRPPAPMSAASTSTIRTPATAPIDEIVSLTVIGPDVLEADRFATAAFAMGKDGIGFIEQTPGLEGYLVDRNGRATFTSGFESLLRAMIKIIDRFLDRITMYRLVLYYLIALVGVGAGPRLLRHRAATIRCAIAFSTVLILAVCWVTNRVFARVFGVPANHESIYITALILALILDPVAPTDARASARWSSPRSGRWRRSSSSPIGRKHVFNPAAFGVAAARAAARSAGDLVGRRQPAAAAGRAGRRRALVRKLQRLRSRRDLHPRRRSRPCSPPPRRRSTARRSSETLASRRRCSSSPSSC